MTDVGPDHPFHPFLQRGRPVVLDGGVATTLEESGHVFDDELWSARLLLDAPDEIQRVHAEFLDAGSDCIATTTYQASFQAFENRGLEHSAAETLIRLSVDLALAARDGYQTAAAAKNRPSPIVAASVGPYGAFLADGSEYTGAYGLSEADLYDFHRDRWQVLADSGADMLALETIPSGPEVRVLLRLLEESPGVHGWISFSCRDASRLCDGTPVTDAARLCHEVDGVAAVGVNCVPPDLVAPLVARIREATDKPVVVYPNSGERYDARTKAWAPGAEQAPWPAIADTWVASGVSAIGGCCRIGPEDIRTLSALLDRS